MPGGKRVGRGEGNQSDSCWHFHIFSSIWQPFVRKSKSKSFSKFYTRHEAIQFCRKYCTNFPHFHIFSSIWQPFVRKSFSKFYTCEAIEFCWKWCKYLTFDKYSWAKYCKNFPHSRLLLHLPSKLEFVCLDHNWDECLNLYPWSMYLGRILQIPCHLFMKVVFQTHYFHAFTGSRKFTGIRIIAQFPPSNGVVGLHTPSAPAVSKWQFSGSGISEKDRLHPWHYNLHIRPFQIFLLLGFRPLALQWVVAVRTLWYRGFK